MVRVRVRQVAEERGFTISKLVFAAQIHRSVATRYWFGTAKGTKTGEPIQEVSLEILSKIARALEVRVVDLIEED